MLTRKANIIAWGEQHLQALIGAARYKISIDEVRVLIIPIYAIETSIVIFEIF